MGGWGIGRWGMGWVHQEEIDEDLRHWPPMIVWSIHGIVMYMEITSEVMKVTS